MRFKHGFTQHYFPRRKSNAGFTLLELLVVIGIIGILITIILVSLNQARITSQASGILQNFQQLERAMFLFADLEDIHDWWEDDSFGLGPDPTIQNLIDNTELSIFLNRAPSPFIGDVYRYSTASGSYNCNSANPTLGVNLTLSNVPQTYFDIIDKIMDNGDGDDCGKISYDNTTIYYKLGASLDSY